MGQSSLETPASGPRSALHRRVAFGAASSFEQAGIAASLLILSVLTTMSTGAVLMYNFNRGAPPFSTDDGLFPLAWIVRHPEYVGGGWPFSLTLLGILTTHEIGHYLACHRHGVRSSLPWVLPAPTLIGTFGAFIRLRSRVPSRVALLDIGISGPIFGVVAAIPALIIGLLLSQSVAHTGFQAPVSISVSVPLGLTLVHHVMGWFDPALPPLDVSLNPHPVLVAAWIGLFITSVNLIPAGQLDGGHILYAVSPRLHRWFTDTITFLLFFAGTMLWIGWLVWGCFLLLSSLRHPRVPDEPPVSGWHFSLAAAGFALFVLTFTPQPFAGGSLMNYLH
jgi:Peptidase family M50